MRREGNELAVAVLAKTYCGGVSATQPEARIAAKSVALSWVWAHPENGPLTACICARHLEFRVIGAPLGDVAVTASAREK